MADKSEEPKNGEASGENAAASLTPEADASPKKAPRKRAPKAKSEAAPAKKKAAPAKKKAAPRKRAPKVNRVTEVAQAAGADVVPSVTIEADAPRKRSDAIVQPASASNDAVTDRTLLSDWDYHLFNEGSHLRLWEKLGAHLHTHDGVLGTMFAVWAPNAVAVSVIGDWNGWSPNTNPLEDRGPSGIWEGFVPNVGKGAHYKFHIRSQFNNYQVNKADPFGVMHETPPQTASVVWDLDYEWSDSAWMEQRAQRNAFSSPMSIYEMHVGSWRRVADEGGGADRPLTYRELAAPLAEYMRKMNFTHVELLPVMEHPFYGSWGYQCTGYFAPTSRFGTPQDLMYLIDVLHHNDIGVILDWVPSHFPTDEHGLSFFDGTHLFEHADPRKGFQPDWGSLVFNLGRREVQSFLLSSAIYWLGVYHADGLRVDAVASMLYLDYSRKHGEWIPNEHGGRENLEAIAFLRRLNEDVYAAYPDVQVIAEESTSWPMVSRPTYIGGLGFGMKWDMGWMHDTLRYFALDSVHRKFHHNDLTFRMMYAFSENFLLPLSHDEVVHGKGSLIRKMPGDEWRRFANLRLLYAHMYSQPAKKLMFMGCEFGQFREWNHDAALNWNELDAVPNATLQRWVEDLNKAYRDIPALHELDFSPDGFEWIDCCDTENSIVVLMRKSSSQPEQPVVVALNFTPLPRYNYMVGVPQPGHWAEILNSDSTIYGGSGQGNMGGVDAAPIPLHGRRWSVSLTLPPLGAVFLTPGGESDLEEAAAEVALAFAG